MLILISPSKTLDLDTPAKTKTYTTPDFLSESQKLIDRMQVYSKPGIMKLMKVSEKIAALNYKRFRQWQIPFTIDNAKQAIFSFKGDVYTGLDIDQFTQQEIKFCQKHLRILSGLYGLIRPLDLIQPYRLEMGINFDAKTKDSLYRFWDEKITQAVNSALKKQGDNFLVNLASNEYYKVIQAKNIKGDIITPNFKEYKNGDYKMIGLFAKRARGMMSRFIIKNKIGTLEDLKLFDFDHYRYNKKLSSDLDLVFTRNRS